MVFSYLFDIFASQGILPNELQTVLNVIVPCVTSAMNEDLLDPVTVEEVKFVVFQIHPLKSLRLGEMSPLFYQIFWHIVGGDVVEAVLFVL